MRSAILFGTNLAVGTAVLAWVAWRFGAPALALMGAQLSPGLLVAFLVAVFLGFLGFALRWRLLLEGMGATPPLVGLLGWRAAGQSVSSLVPSAKLGGEPVRAWLLMRAGVPAPAAIASVAVDRTLEMGASGAFAVLFALVLLRRGVPALEGALVTVSVSVAALAVGAVLTARRLRRGSGVVTAVARATGLDRLALVRQRIETLAEADALLTALVARPRRLGSAFAIGVGVNLMVLLEYHFLLAAFGLPADGLAVVAAVFATGAAHSLPVPAAVGTLEGAQMFLFGTLGHPPEVGLAIGLAVRLRELAWIAPGVVYLLVRGVRPGRGWRLADAGDDQERRPQTAAARSPG